MTRIFNVVVRETLEGGQQLLKNLSVVAIDLTDAVEKTHAKIAEQPEHAERYEIISASLGAEAE